MIFSDVHFGGTVHFFNRKLSHGTNFGGAVFQGIPEFSECEIPESIDFALAEFQYVGADAANAYMTLRRTMEERRDRRAEGRFYALEMRCRRETDSGPEAFLSWLYDVTSGYGQSIVRPPAILLSLSGIFLLAYFFVFFICEMNEFAAAFHADEFKFMSDVLSFTIDQMVRPFGIWSGRYDAPIDIADKVLESGGFFLRVLSTLHGLVTLGLMALFLIAARWRYRRG